MQEEDDENGWESFAHQKLITLAPPKLEGLVLLGGDSMSDVIRLCKLLTICHWKVESWKLEVGS